MRRNGGAESTPSNGDNAMPKPKQRPVPNNPERPPASRAAESAATNRRQFSWIDCVQWPPRRAVSKAEMDDAQRHLWPESESPAFKAHVQACVDEQGSFTREHFDKKRTNPAGMDGPACSGLTAVERMIAALRSAEQFSEILKEREQHRRPAAGTGG